MEPWMKNVRMTRGNFRRPATNRPTKAAHDRESVAIPREDEQMKRPLADRDVPMIDSSSVFKAVISSIQCPKLLRTCRLVCPSWNKIACKVLQTISTVTIDENQPNRIDDFLELRKDSKTPAFEDLPSPFRKVRLVASDFTNNSLLKFIMDLDDVLTISELSLQQCGPHDKSQPRNIPLPGICLRILKRYKESLTTLEILWENLEKNVNTNMISSLKNVRNVSLYVGSKSKPLLKKILSLHNHIKVLTLRIKKSIPKFLSSALHLDVIPSVKLHIDWSSFKSRGKNPIDSLSLLPSLNLTELKMSIWDEFQMMERLHLFSRFARSLEVLDVDFTFVPTALPTCPKLKELVCRGALQHGLNEQKFPSLMKVTLFEAHCQSQLQQKVAVSHYGVEELVFIPRKKSDELDNDRHLYESVKSLAKLFPCAKNSFTIDIREYCAGSARDESAITRKLAKFIAHLRYYGSYCCILKSFE